MSSPHQPKPNSPDAPRHNEDTSGADAFDAATQGPVADHSKKYDTAGRKNPALMEVRVRRIALALLVAVPLIYYIVTLVR